MLTRALVLMMGLPYSGKTTWVRAAALMSNSTAVVSPDAIRGALHGQRYRAESEDMVWATARAMVRALFGAGHQVVVVDATHVSRKRREEWYRGFRGDVRVFVRTIWTPAEECLRRAQEAGDEEILPVIERMDGEWENPGKSEELWPPPEWGAPMAEELGLFSERRRVRSGSIWAPLPVVEPHVRFERSVGLIGGHTRAMVPPYVVADPSWEGEGVRLMICDGNGWAANTEPAESTPDGPFSGPAPKGEWVTPSSEYLPLQWKPHLERFRERIRERWGEVEVADADPGKADRVLKVKAALN
jgi:predicted kinase